MRIQKFNELNSSPEAALVKGKKFEPDFAKIKSTFNEILEDNHIDLVKLEGLKKIVKTEHKRAEAIHSVLKTEINKIHDEYKKNPTDDEESEKLVGDLENTEMDIYEQIDKLEDYLEILEELSEVVDQENDLVTSLRKFKF